MKRRQREELESFIGARVDEAVCSLIADYPNDTTTLRKLRNDIGARTSFRIAFDECRADELERIMKMRS